MTRQRVRGGRAPASTPVQTPANVPLSPILPAAAAAVEIPDTTVPPAPASGSSEAPALANPAFSPAMRAELATWSTGLRAHIAADISASLAALKAALPPASSAPAPAPPAPALPAAAVDDPALFTPVYPVTPAMLAAVAGFRAEAGYVAAITAALTSPGSLIAAVPQDPFDRAAFEYAVMLRSAPTNASSSGVAPPAAAAPAPVLPALPAVTNSTPEWAASLMNDHIDASDASVNTAMLPANSANLAAIIRGALELGSGTNAPHLPRSVITEWSKSARRVFFVPYPGARVASRSPIVDDWLEARLASALGSAAPPRTAQSSRDLGATVPRAASYAAWSADWTVRTHQAALRAGRVPAQAIFHAVTEFGLLVLELSRVHPWAQVSRFCQFVDALWARTNLLVTGFNEYVWLAATAAAASAITPAVTPAANPAANPSARAPPTSAPGRSSRFWCSACALKGWSLRCCPRCHPEIPGSAMWIAAFNAGTSPTDSVPARENNSSVPVPARQ